SAGKERRTLACGPGCDEIARCVPDVGGYTRDRTAADDVESRAPIGQTEREALPPSDVDDSRRDRERVAVTENTKGFGALGSLDGQVRLGSDAGDVKGAGDFAFGADGTPCQNDRAKSLAGVGPKLDRKRRRH